MATNISEYERDAVYSPTKYHQYGDLMCQKECLSLINPGIAWPHKSLINPSWILDEDSS